MRLNSFMLATAVFVILFGGIGVSTALNYWQTETSKIPVKYEEGAAAGQYNPADIRGSYTFGDVSDLFNIPLEDLQVAFRLPSEADVATFSLKSLEELYTDLPVEMGTSAVRMFTAFYNGLPYDLTSAEESSLFPEAADILREKGSMLPEQSAYLENHTLSLDNMDAQQIDATPVMNDVQTAAAPTPVENTTQSTTAATEHSITGKTTFQELLDWGLSAETISAILQEQMPASNLIIKDYLSSKGLEFSTIKTALQAEIDKLP